MARLNEASAPAAAPAAHTSDGNEQLTAESFEAVRRSLMRQNRQIARSHSGQSLQIRTLGTQISTLLAANTVLKEENIRLRKELSNAQKQAYKSGIETVKEALNAQLKCMATLINGMGEDIVVPLSPQVSPETRKSMCLEGMQFRDRPSLREIMDEMQMPAIQEMSAILEGESLARLSEASVESADLGPPPVSRTNLDVEPVVPESPSQVRTSDQDLAIVHASINVEARRRRKESISGQARRRSTLVTPFKDTECSPAITKNGAKRKLADRESESISAKMDENDDFQFTRRNSLAGLEKPLALTKPVRSVLGAKSINISPKKQKMEDINAKPDKPKVSATRDLGHVSSRRRSRQPAVTEIRLDGDEDDRQSSARSRPSVLQAQAPLVSTSDQSEEPSKNPAHAESAPTPITTSFIEELPVAAMIKEDTRPSRRARAAVNYAEPSLVAKMRRPGKEMLDALSGLQDPRSVMNATTRKAKTSNLESKAHHQRSPILRKVEDDDEDVLSPTDEPAIETSLSLAALMDNKDIPPRSTIDQALDIYDFDNSSPPQSPQLKSSTSRRHSATVRSNMSDTKLTVKTPSIMAKAAVRRRSMMV